MIESTAKKQVDPQSTQEENFPRIQRPERYDFNLTQCTIDLKDKESHLLFSVAKSQYEHHWKHECHQLCFLIVSHIEAMCELSKLVDDKDTVLTMESPEVK